MTMANTYIHNPRLNLELYRDYLKASSDLSRMDRLRLIVKRIRWTKTTKTTS